MERNGSREGGRNTDKSKKGLGYGIRKYNARPSNTSREFADAALAFLRDTKVGMVKEGVLDKN